MTKSNYSNNNKNTSKYDELLRELKEDHNRVAKELIPKLCEALKEENPHLSNDDIKERIKKDLIDIWSRTTIYENLSDEFKDKEKQEAGKQSHKNVREASDTEPDQKREIAVTTNGSVASDEGHYSSPISQSKSKSGISPIETLAAVKADAEPNKFVPEDPRIEELELENGRLKEQLKEQHDQIQELIKSVNASVEIKQQTGKQPPTQAKETLEYKALFSEKAILEERIIELEALVKKDPKLGFQNATQMQRESNENAANMHPTSNEITTITTTTIPNEVEFPARDLSTMFLDSRNAKQIMYLKIDGNKVIGWESDFKRSSSGAGKK